jgi:hypothetical protein
MNTNTIVCRKCGWFCVERQSRTVTKDGEFVKEEDTGTEEVPAYCVVCKEVRDPEELVTLTYEQVQEAIKEYIRKSEKQDED